MTPGPCPRCGFYDCAEYGVCTPVPAAPSRSGTFAAVREELARGRNAAGLPDDEPSARDMTAAWDALDVLRARCTALARRVTELEDRVNALTRKGTSR